MILSDQTIRQKVGCKEIEITPEPKEEQFQPASLDIRIGDGLYDYNYDHFPDTSEGLTFEPGRCYLGFTRDKIGLPKNIAAQLSGRSSLGRVFVTVHQTAGWLDPGFSGQVTLEIVNFSGKPTTVQPGDRIGQLVFFPTDKETEGYSGQYQGQYGPTESGEI